MEPPSPLCDCCTIRQLIHWPYFRRQALAHTWSVAYAVFTTNVASQGIGLLIEKVTIIAQAIFPVRLNVVAHVLIIRIFNSEDVVRGQNLRIDLLYSRLKNVGILFKS